MNTLRAKRPRRDRVLRHGAAIVFTLSLLLAAPFNIAAQQTAKVYRIGYLSYLGCSDDPFLPGPFRQGLRDLGYVEGRNIVIECRSAPGKADRYPDLVADLIRLKIDVLLATGTIMTLAAKPTTTTVPIVMVYIADPVASGIVSNLARPGANVTGLSMLAAEMVQKNLELLKEAAPSIARVTVLIDPSNPGQTLPDQQMAAAAKILGVRPQRVELRTSTDLDTALESVLKQRAQALIVWPIPITPRDSERLAAFAIKNRLPTATTYQQYVRAGLLFSYVTDMGRQFRRAAVYVDKILRGTKPGDIPVEQPDKYELLINLKTAKALGLQIPKSILVRVDEFIQ
jgi:putative tryptophan/tyrosine transport system substrate-binding protein